MESSPSALNVTTLSLEKFSNLPKNEANIEQWTVISTIVQHDSKTNESKVVALGTGTKCIGVDKLCPKGSILNDCHAEIICRRSFLRYIYYNLLNNKQLFEYNESKSCFILKDSITFHFFSTHPPCGDATIIEEDNDENFVIANKRPKLENNQVFTGAKLLGVVKHIDFETGQRYDPLDQDLGALRTKPGRGVRTLSMSCSDKLSKWNILGIQGAFLDSLLERPIYLKTLTFCGNIAKESIQRCIYDRWKSKEFHCDRFKAHTPEIRTLQVENFQLARLNDKKPSSKSISWCDIPEEDRNYETIINGKKEGLTKKALKQNPLNGASELSKLLLLKKYVQILETHRSVLKRIIKNDCDISCTMSYKELKDLSSQYQNAWKTLKTDYFGNWTIKPQELLNFCVK